MWMCVRVVALDPLELEFRWLGAIQCVGSELSSGPLDEQQALLAAELASQLQLGAFNIFSALSSNDKGREMLSCGRSWPR